MLVGSRHPSQQGPHTAVRVDVTDASSVRAVLRRWRPSVVALCVDVPDGSLHAVCLEEGVSVVDVTASAEQFANVEALAPIARKRGASIVLSVGVAPGLTNVLARQAVSALGGHAESVDLTVMVGAREEHGAEAVRWTIDGILEPDAAHHSARRVDVPGIGRRTAHDMPFADQVSLRRTLGVPSVTTRLCLDSRALTWLLFGFGRSRLGRRVLGSGAGRAALTGASGRLPIGGEDFVVLAEAEDAGRRAAWWVRAEARAGRPGWSRPSRRGTSLAVARRQGSGTSISCPRCSPIWLSSRTTVLSSMGSAQRRATRRGRFERNAVRHEQRENRRTPRVRHRHARRHPVGSAGIDEDGRRPDVGDDGFRL